MTLQAQHLLCGRAGAGASSMDTAQGSALSERWATAAVHPAKRRQGSKAIADGPVSGSAPRTSHIG
eukprot:14561822-Alexandrium_andersonii.AAC.1